MSARICAVCGNALHKQGSTCECCKSTFPTEKKQRNFIPEQALYDLCVFLNPAYENPDKMASCQKNIEKYLEKYKYDLSKNACEFLLKKIEDAFRTAQSRWESHKSANDRAAKKALKIMESTLDIRSDYKGLGFSAITDFEGAIAYTVLDAVQGHISDMTKTVNVYKKALSDLQEITFQSNFKDIIKPISDTINELIFCIGKMLENKPFVDNFRESYANFSCNKSIRGINILDLLKAASEDNDFLGKLTNNKEKREAYCIIEAAGYIQLYYIVDNPIYFYYSTTGKLEAEILREQFKKEHPEELAEYVDSSNKKLRARADELIGQKSYYEAAIRYAQITNDKDAIRKSISIWNEKFRMPEIIGGNLLSFDGTVEQIYKGNNKKNIPSALSLSGKPVRFSKLYSNIGLSYDGRVYSNEENIYWEVNIPKSELGKIYLNGNGSDWTNVRDISYGLGHLVALHEDGTVSAVGRNTFGQCNLSDWKDVESIHSGYNYTIAFKTDGTILLTDLAEKHFAECRKWKNIRKIYTNENGMVCLFNDGHVKATGELDFDKSVLETWTNVVSIYWKEGTVFGITETGDVLCSNQNEIFQRVCNRMKGVVKIVFFDKKSYSYVDNLRIVAHCADGTIFTHGFHHITPDWSHIVLIDCRIPFGSCIPQFFAIQPNGDLLFCGTEFCDTAKDFKTFVNIDESIELHRNSLHETYKEFADKLMETKGIFKIKQKKALQASVEFLQKKLN